MILNEKKKKNNTGETRPTYWIRKCFYFYFFIILFACLNVLLLQCCSVFRMNALSWICLQRVMLTREWPCMHASLAVLPVTEIPAEICHYYWLMLFLSPPHQGPALHARRIPAPTWVCASSSGRTSPATAPWPLTLAPSAMTVSDPVTLYFADCNIKLIFGVALSLRKYNYAGYALNKSDYWLHPK